MLSCEHREKPRVVSLLQARLDLALVMLCLKLVVFLFPRSHDPCLTTTLTERNLAARAEGSKRSYLGVQLLKPKQRQWLTTTYPLCSRLTSHLLGPCNFTIASSRLIGAHDVTVLYMAIFSSNISLENEAHPSRDRGSTPHRQIGSPPKPCRRLCTSTIHTQELSWLETGVRLDLRE